MKKPLYHHQKDFYSMIEEDRAKKLLILSSNSQYLIGGTEVYVNSELFRETIYLDNDLKVSKDTQSKYQLFFTRNKNQLGFNTIVQGNCKDDRYNLGFRVLKGYKIAKILKQIIEIWQRENIESTE